MLTFHFVGRALMYSRNSRSNHQPCLCRIKNGLSPEFSRLKTCNLSKHFNISVRRWPVMEPLLEWQQKQGMCFPLKKQPGPKGYTFLSPQLSTILICWSRLLQIPLSTRNYMPSCCFVLKVKFTRYGVQETSLC